MLLEQITEFYFRGPGPWMYIYQYSWNWLFSWQNKNLLGKSSRELFNAKNIAEGNILKGNVPCFPWPWPSHKYKPEMQDFKRVLYLTWSKGRDFFQLVFKSP